MKFKYYKWYCNNKEEVAYVGALLGLRKASGDSIGICLAILQNPPDIIPRPFNNLYGYYHRNSIVDIGSKYISISKNRLLKLTGAKIKRRMG